MTFHDPGAHATRALHDTIRQFNVEASCYSKRLLWLTVVIAVLTLVMTIGVGVQIYLAWRPLP